MSVRLVRFLLGPLLISLWLAGCSSVSFIPASRYSLSQDVGPEGEFDASTLPDAVPRYELPSRSGNKSPYVVWGKTYEILPDITGYREEGVASWYGVKFHGHATASGEPYNMYALTAAHKSLPLPSYVRVTNLENGLSTVVKVNDRGPFHEGRIIDLSYAAATKLGYSNKGTARVALEAIVVPPPQVALATEATLPASALESTPVSPVLSNAQPQRPEKLSGEKLPTLLAGYGYFIQVGAFAVRDSADRMVAALLVNGLEKVFVHDRPENGKSAQRVRLGPFYTPDDIAQQRSRLQQLGYSSTIVLTRPIAESVPASLDKSQAIPSASRPEGIAG
ncbi:MAG: septal ring lytic transglycosylase RlpA family protein [Hahellaceae bacterium]|nr:septal ring lytic transglycosylase RlpA family protein [Hahellaceae bacterium]MCP5169899.1 septal ring lytic transglycosylase RlpA family protein [Hahellaceae bacterium]